MRELSPGRLSLVEMHGSYVSLEMPERKQAAATLLYYLLTLHRCVVSVALNGYIFKSHHELICDGLRRSPSLSKLKLCLLNVATLAAESFSAALPHMNHLREFEVRQVHFDRTFTEGLSWFLASTRSLTTLTISHVHVDSEDAFVILRGLQRNTTITKLAVNTCIMNPVGGCGVIFASYLRRNPTLRSLSVMSRYMKDVIELRLIIDALFPNDTLVELNLSHFSLECENIQRITNLLRKNRSLKSFNLLGCVWHQPAWQSCASESTQHMEKFGKVSSRIHPWLVALTENKTLVELTLDLSCFNVAECCSFIKALASCASLKRITIERLQREDVTEICRAMREMGTRLQFFLGMHYAIQDPVVTLTECKELTCVSFDSTDVHEPDSLRTTLCLLPSSTHVTSLCLRVSQELLNSQVSSLIAKYIAGTRVLRELALAFFFDSDTWDIVDAPERALVRALSVNRSIRRLSIRGLLFNDTETRMLADLVQSSRVIYHLTFYPDNYESAASLIQNLSKNISSNYTLLGMQLSQRQELGQDWFTIVDVTRRNSSLVTRAANFVMGMRHKYCAEAVELVHFNPGLVSLVQEHASIDENEAVSRIKSSLKSFHDMDDFMRVAGVVRDRVTCHKRDDGQKQLVDLNQYCWLHIRQYLKVGDILDAP